MQILHNSQEHDLQFLFAIKIGNSNPVASFELFAGQMPDSSSKTKPIGLTSNTTELGKSGVLPCILIADDDVGILGLCAEFLTHSGYKVNTAENGALAWEELHSARYDLLITDNKMPQMTGIELIRKLRLEGNSLPTILASGSLTAETIGTDGSLRPISFLPKPFNLEELVEVVRGILPSTPSPEC